MALAGLAMVVLVIFAGGLGGCASNASDNWAQTAPVIAPDSTSEATVSLGAVEHGS